MEYGIKKDSEFSVILFKVKTTNESSEEIFYTNIIYEVDNNCIYLEDQWEDNLDEPLNGAIDCSEYIKKYTDQIPIIIPNFVYKSRILEDYKEAIDTAITIIINTCNALKKKYRHQSIIETKEDLIKEIIEKGKSFSELFSSDSPTLIKKIGEDQQ